MSELIEQELSDPWVSIRKAYETYDLVAAGIFYKRYFSANITDAMKAVEEKATAEGWKNPT